MNFLRTETRLMSVGFDSMLSVLIRSWVPPHPPAFQPILIQVANEKIARANIGYQCDDWLLDPFLWNTPKRRRNLETRQKRRFGSKEWGSYKLPVADKSIRVDHSTGEYYQLGKLAPLTYQKIMEETKLIQKKMSECFGVGNPRNEEVMVLYKGDSKQSVPDSVRIVEMDTERPSFFSRTLMQKSGTGKDQQSNTSTVKPTGLV